MTALTYILHGKYVSSSVSIDFVRLTSDRGDPNLIGLTGFPTLLVGFRKPRVRKVPPKGFLKKFLRMISLGPKTQKVR